ncbi:META domain-containing protein [Thalassotalea euphylliae]|uniref:META domain-containing protein n=1 Tax=Thalassotalea euphylliae TaxID=1655234 RepID=A0A3E0TVY6_9GAMM|nr:META domain-containing protein [Thalassotalea euphylliae]REL28590.1 META domain-containing protein [Thalassotalea euphylliae]
MNKGLGAACVVASTLLTVSACSNQAPVNSATSTTHSSASASSSASNTAQVNAMHNMERLHQHQWQLVELEGSEDVSGYGGKPISLRFDSAQQQISGFSGCNRYFGAYTADQTTLSLGHLAMTKMFCQQGMALEAKFAKAVTQVASYEVVDQTLTFIDQQGTAVARFKKD